MWRNGLDRSGRDRWRALVNGVMNLRGSIKCGKFVGQLKTSQILKKDSVA